MTIKNFSIVVLLLAILFFDACIDENLPPDDTAAKKTLIDDDTSGDNDGDDADKDTDSGDDDSEDDSSDGDSGSETGDDTDSDTDDGAGDSTDDTDTDTGSDADDSADDGDDSGTGGGTDSGGEDTSDGMDGTTDDDDDDDDTNDGSADNYRGVWVESDNIIVMEVENTLSDLGKWQFQSKIPGHSGTGYLRFMGNSAMNGDPDSPLVYEFRVENAGDYQLEIHSSRDPGNNHIENDWSNDIYIRMEGDFRYVRGKAIKNVLINDNKFFTSFTANADGSAPLQSWKFGFHIATKTDEYPETWYGLKAGETYKLIISGRSKFYIIDRIVLSNGYGKARRRSITEESVRE